MIERTRYVRLDGAKCGVVTILYENGKFGAGMSLCRTDEDKFDKKIGKDYAMARALESLNKDNLLLKDLIHPDYFHGIVKMTRCNFPQSAWENRSTERRICNAATVFDETVYDMIYTLALSKVKSETV